MKPNCAKCPKRGTCTELCAEVIAYIGGQPPEKTDGRNVHVPTNRLPPEFIDKTLAGMSVEPSKRNRRIVIDLYFKDHRRQVDIVQLTGLTKQRVSKIICNEKKR